MTNEEMAQVLEEEEQLHICDMIRWAKKLQADSPEYQESRRKAESCKAGAAALRAMEWKPIKDAPEVIEHGALWGHRYPDGRFHSDVLTHRDTAIRLMHTNYLTLPAPPEGV